MTSILRFQENSTFHNCLKSKIFCYNSEQKKDFYYKKFKTFKEEVEDNMRRYKDLSFVI